MRFEMARDSKPDASTKALGSNPHFFVMTERASSFMARLYRSNSFLPFRWKRRVKEAIYERAGFLFANTTSYRLYQQHRGNPLRAPAEETARINGRLSLDQHRNIFVEDAKQQFEVFLSSAATLRFGGKENAVDCTVIVVVYNKDYLTYMCLQALARQLCQNIELLIVDNASTDQTGRLLDRLEGSVRVFRNSDNVHFLKACNQAFAHVRPESGAVALVNNDALVHPLSIINSLKCLERFPTSGAVAGKILHLDDNLQEAGSIVFSDGSCLGIGRRDNPYKPLYNIRRQIDFGSGCFLVIRKSCLDLLEGFDPQFAPAYYEETDFCLRLQDKGWKVLYEPSCVVKHVEYGSSDGNFRAVRPLMEANRKRLLAKHAKQLAKHPSPISLQTIQPDRLLSHLATMDRILWIDDTPPRASRGSGFGRVEQILSILATQGFWISLFATNAKADAAEQLLSSDYELLTGGREDLEKLLHCRADFYTHICASRHHNIKLTSDIVLKKYQDIQASRSRPILLADVESLFSVREHTRSQFIKHRKVLDQDFEHSTAEMDQELAQLSLFDRVLSVSDVERDIIQTNTGRPTWTVGHVVKAKACQSAYEDSNGILFLGAIHDENSPNLDSLKWLLNEVLPAFYRLPSCHKVPLTIAGFHEEKIVRPLYKDFHDQFPLVSCLGFVEDLSTLMCRHRVFIAPTRFAAGLPHKVHEATCHGLPVVTTPLIAKQMTWRDQGELLTASSGEGFANAMARLYHDRQLWETIQQAAQVKLRLDCDASSIGATLQDAFRRDRDN